ncbi:GNAT family N-acetyltransferase [Cerasicoccus maritimus]|uniref:GNAT family N-acetyltransferase n=1 Tax=Cerasicoccus maritimus TaxID=490089 RepID=UPI002852CE1B|nr:GNAT family N-acetyltransferase [Cerasicoccus maritimus]
MALEVKAVVGPDAPEYGEALARLRITVFREFPYLYEGAMEYEQQYLHRYLECPECLFVLAFDGADVVGASTGLPMEYEVEQFTKPFTAHGFDIGKVFYFGESVLLPGYRGQGIGHRFFDEREAYARSLGRFDLTTFCAVERPVDHPLRPANYRPHDVFWGKRGYVKRPEIATTFEWRDVDQAEDSAHPMVFWTRDLD